MRKKEGTRMSLPGPWRMYDRWVEACYILRLLLCKFQSVTLGVNWGTEIGA